MTHWRQLMDYDLQFLEELAELLDSRIDDVEEQAAHLHNEQISDPGFVIDRSEYLIGLGFVACQTYLTEVMGERLPAERIACLALGPKHNGRPIAAVVDAAANFVKHKAEGDLRQRTRQLMEECGVLPTPPSDGPMYPMRGLLIDLLGDAPTTFVRLLDSLERWRDAVLNLGP